MTRRGKSAVMVVATIDYVRLKAAASTTRKSFAEHLLSYPHTPEGDKDFVIEPMPSRMRDIEF